MKPAIFLDRDMTLIRNDGYLADPDDVEILPGVPDALVALREAGYRLIVVTNQAGVAKGLHDDEAVDAVHRRLDALLADECGGHTPIDRYYYSPYHPKGTVAAYACDHPWRKPQPGMLLAARDDLEIDLAASWMVGDQRRDVAAGRAAGCRTVRIGDPLTLQPEPDGPDIFAVDVPTAARMILAIDGT